MAETRQKEDDNDEDALPPQHPTALPKPIRLFSYIFFSVVLVAGVLGWMLTQH